MKTTNNISNLKKTVITVCASLFLTASGFASTNAAGYKSEEMASEARLEAQMNSTEVLIKYVAPAAMESEAVFSAMERLNVMADQAEISLQYTAPAVEQVSAEMRDLDEIAASTEAGLKYVAPAAEETSL
jgi:hypothetical protein